jgi:hypothetical protein
LICEIYVTEYQKLGLDTYEITNLVPQKKTTSTRYEGQTMSLEVTSDDFDDNSFVYTNTQVAGIDTVKVQYNPLAPGDVVMSDLKPGKYTLEFYSCDDTFSESFNIEIDKDIAIPILSEE